MQIVFDLVSRTTVVCFRDTIEIFGPFADSLPGQWLDRFTVQTLSFGSLLAHLVVLLKREFLLAGHHRTRNVPWNKELSATFPGAGKSCECHVD
jgi:hypothetical protein